MLQKRQEGGGGNAQLSHDSTLRSGAKLKSACRSVGVKGDSFLCTTCRTVQHREANPKHTQNNTKSDVMCPTQIKQRALKNGRSFRKNVTHKLCRIMLREPTGTLCNLQTKRCAVSCETLFDHLVDSIRYERLGLWLREQVRNRMEPCLLRAGVFSAI